MDSFKRLISYYSQHGFFKTAKRIIRTLDRLFRHNESMLFFADIADLKNNTIELPIQLSIEKITKKEELTLKDLGRILSHSHSGIIDHQMNERFMKGAVLWILKTNGNIAGFEWSIRGRNTIEPYFFPLTPNDAIIFDAHTWEGYRGKGYNAILVHHIMVNLSNEEVTRIYANIKNWNRSSLEVIKKTHLRPFGIARKFQIKNKIITISNAFD